MINPFNSKYLSPTKQFRKLSLLLAIHESPESSQHHIGETTMLSASMVNNYIKIFSSNGLIDVYGETHRNRSYHLTKSGQKQLRESLLSYSSEIVQLYSAVKREISRILECSFKEGIRTIVLFGASETAEIVYASIRGTQLVVIGVVDNDLKKHGILFNGLIVQHPDQLKKINPDAVIITSFAQQEEIGKSIRKFVGKSVKIKKLSLI